MSKTAIVTGAKQGIGRAIALTLARDGFNVVVNVPAPAFLEEGEAVAKECEALGVKAKCIPADVSSFSQCEEMVKETVETFGSVDVLVNNAGITKDGLVARMKEEQYDAVIAINQKGVFNMMRHVTPVMMKQRYGRIISISSVTGLYGNPGQLNYAASKAAIVGMTLSIAKELGARNVTANAVAPGFIQTDMTGQLADKAKEAMTGAIALGRPGQPQDVAEAVAFLASEKAAYITGQVICVDGGMMI